MAAATSKKGLCPKTKSHAMNGMRTISPRYVPGIKVCLIKVLNISDLE
jgi:hypothetical protein